MLIELPFWIKCLMEVCNRALFNHTLCLLCIGAPVHQSLCLWGHVDRVYSNCTVRSTFLKISRQRRTSGQGQFQSRVASSRCCISQFPQRRSQLAPGSELCWGQTNRACQRAASSDQLAQRGGIVSHRTARRAGARAWMVADLPRPLRAADSQLDESASKSQCDPHRKFVFFD